MSKSQIFNFRSQILNNHILNKTKLKILNNQSVMPNTNMYQSFNFNSWDNDMFCNQNALC